MFQLLIVKIVFLDLRIIKLISWLGVKDIIAIAMPDAVLVANKNRAQDVKKVVEKLKSKGVEQAENFQKNIDLGVGMNL